jgi:hypothetical protein
MQTEEMGYVRNGHILQTPHITRTLENQAIATSEWSGEYEVNWRMSIVTCFCYDDKAKGTIR